MNKPKRRVNLTKRYIKQLNYFIGSDYLEKIIKLREDVEKIKESESYTYFDISVRASLYIDTVQDFLEGRNNISYKTYKLLENFVFQKKRV